MLLVLVFDLLPFVFLVFLVLRLVVVLIVRLVEVLVGGVLAVPGSARFARSLSALPIEAARELIPETKAERPASSSRWPLSASFASSGVDRSVSAPRDMISEETPFIRPVAAAAPSSNAHLILCVLPSR